ncbi:hypothetical protein SAMN05421821_103183 [Mucilaginibacter lappiensis]|nr:hypothetical protein SAMN05421821_103183 [Mucilaginibacter lappiensis]
MAQALHFIDHSFSVGNKLQNIAFYAILLLMIWVIIVQLKTKQRKTHQ